MFSHIGPAAACDVKMGAMAQVRPYRGVAFTTQQVEACVQKPTPARSEPA